VATDRAALRDHIEQVVIARRDPDEPVGIRGTLRVVVTGPDGEIKYDRSTANLVTQVGDQYYADRAAAIGSIAAITGMQLGTGTTGVAKTGAGAAVVTLVASSLVALTGGFPASTLSGASRRIQYQTVWAAGTATANNIAEVVLVNQSTGTQTAAPAANTIARALLSPNVNKGASDTLTIQWNHDLLGS
jgi:hypothetical protein